MQSLNIMKMRQNVSTEILKFMTDVFLVIVFGGYVSHISVSQSH